MTEPTDKILLGVISAEWEFNIIVNCHNGEGYAFGRENLKGTANKRSHSENS